MWAVIVVNGKWVVQYQTSFTGSLWYPTKEQAQDEADRRNKEPKP